MNEQYETIDYSKNIASSLAKAMQIREQIQQTAGDSNSLLGTTADTSQLLFYQFSQLVSKLHSAQSIEQVREAAAPFAEIAQAFLAKVENGQVKLPFMTKGVDKVVADIEQRATAVTQVLEASGDKKKQNAKTSKSEQTTQAEKPKTSVQKTMPTEVAAEKVQNVPETQVDSVKPSEAVKDHKIDTEVIQKIIAEQLQQFLQQVPQPALQEQVSQN